MGKEVKYVFHSEKTKTTCNECLKHDGEIYYDIKDIPKLPLHPNCKCWIETIELAASKDTKCNCANRFKVLENNLTNLMKNSDLMLDSIKDNIIEIEEEIEENNKEKIKNRFYLIENRIKDFKKECRNLYIDIGVTKEFNCLEIPSGSGLATSL